MTSKFNHELLLLARQYRGLSQAEVAYAAGLDQGHYSRIERGLLYADPSESAINAICSAIRFPPAFFWQSDEIVGLPLSVHDVAWRKKASLPASEMKRLQAELNIRIIHLRRLLTSIDIENELPLPRLDVDEFGGADKIAQYMRKTWAIPEGPVSNLTKLCERAGIIIVICHFAEQVDGVTMRLRDVPPIIFLNKKAPADRMRHSLAHELGHLIMHATPSDNMEEEADLFAGELLAPASQLRSDLIGGRATLERFVQLKKYWRVSVASLVYRASRANLISKNQSDYLWRQISKRGWRKTEPEDTQFPPEPTRLFDQIITLHKEELAYSSAELESLLCASQADLQALYGIEPNDKPKPLLRLVK